MSGPLRAITIVSTSTILTNTTITAPLFGVAGPWKLKGWDITGNNNGSITVRDGNTGTSPIKLDIPVSAGRDRNNFLHENYILFQNGVHVSAVTGGNVVLYWG